MQLVEDGRQAAAQRQQLGARAVEANAHGALQGHAASVTQQRAERKDNSRDLRKSQSSTSEETSHSFNLHYSRVCYHVHFNGVLKELPKCLFFFSIRGNYLSDCHSV